MATVTLFFAFDTDNFWSPLDLFISNDGATYRYQSVAGDFIEVIGTGLTDSGGVPDGGTYTQIIVYDDNTFTTQVATYSSGTAIDFATYLSSGPGTALAGDDTITGSSGNDIINGGDGTDTMNGGEGSDVYRYADGDVDGNDSVNDSGFSGTDVIELVGNATVIDFSSATVLSIEALRFTDLQTAQFDQVQLPGNLAVTGAAGTQAIIVEMTSGTFTAGGWSFTNWGVNDKVNIVGRALGDDNITGSSQEDFITGQGGADTLNGGESGDTYQYSSTSDATDDTINDSGTTGVDRLSLFGNVDLTGSSIQNVEGIFFNGASTATFNAGQFGAGLISSDFLVTGVNATTQTVIVNNASIFSAVSWSLLTWEAADTLIINGSTGGDTLTGSNQNDTINGGIGVDTLRGGVGADTLDGGEGSDIYDYDASEVISGETITDTGTSGKDTIRLLSDLVGEANFSTITTLTGIEAFVFTGDQDLTIDRLPIVGVNFELAGSNGTAQTFTVNNADNFSIAGWTFKNWETSDTITLNGASFAGTLIGSSQRDIINGAANTDTLIGGLGKDTLTGGTEADIFDFNKTTETLRGANRDVITDFSGVNALAPEFDLIDLSTIDARTTRGGNQAFKFIGAQKFHDRAGELHVLNKGTFFLIEGDRNGDGRADFQIQVQNLTNDLGGLVKADFIL